MDNDGKCVKGSSIFLTSSRAVHIKMSRNHEKIICPPQFMFTFGGALRIKFIF